MLSWEDRLIAMKKIKAENDTTTTISTVAAAAVSITTTDACNSNSNNITSSISRPPPLKCSDDSDIKLRSNGSIKIKVTEENQRASISRLLEGSNKKSNNVEVFFTRTFIR